MARLTWKNVDAPDFSDSIRGTYLAGQQFSEAFSGLGDIARGIREQNVQGNTQEAQARAMQVLAQAGGGEKGRSALMAEIANGSFGNPRDLSANFFEGLRNMQADALANENTLTDIQGGRIDNNQSQRNLDLFNSTFDNKVTQSDVNTAGIVRQEGIDQLTDQVALGTAEQDVALLPQALQNREEATIASLEDSARERVEAEDARAGQAYAEKMAATGRFSKEVMEERISKDPSLTPTQRRAALEQLNAINENVYNPDEENVREAAKNPFLNGLDAVVQDTLVATNQAFETSDAVRYYAEAMQNDDGTSAQEFVNEYTNNEGSADDSNDASALFKHIRDNYNVPDSVAKAVIRDSVRGRLGGVFFDNGRIDDGRVKEILGTISEQPQNIRQQAQQFAGVSGKLSEVTQEVGRLRDELARAKQLNDPVMQMEIQARINMLSKDVEGFMDTLPDSVKRMLYGNSQTTTQPSAPAPGKGDERRRNR